jgi:hypothetical protein
VKGDVPCEVKIVSMFDEKFTVAAASERGGTHVVSLANTANLLAFPDAN